MKIEHAVGSFCVIEFVQAAVHEIEILSTITENDPKTEKCVVQLVDHFKHRGPNGQHLCMVLEFLGDSILHLIRFNRYKGINLIRFRGIHRCILTGLDYLHREHILHTDLKPEKSKDPIKSKTPPIFERPEGSLAGGAVVNVIEKKLKQKARRAVAKIAAERRGVVGGVAPEAKPERCLDGIDFRCKIVDLGNACCVDKPIVEEIQTRQYRAPEVILQSGYSFPVDMWSFSCTAFELATGEMMFAPKPGPGFSEDEDHLALMMELLGKMPLKIAVGGGRSKEYFDRHGDLKESVD
ncbi:hypothetical protein R6Q59_013812 [Mikania micrantha]